MDDALPSLRACTHGSLADLALPARVLMFPPVWNAPEVPGPVRTIPLDARVCSWRLGGDGFQTLWQPTGCSLAPLGDIRSLMGYITFSGDEPLVVDGFPVCPRAGWESPWAARDAEPVRS